MRMDLPDVNVLIYAHRPEFESHTLCQRWLETRLNERTPVAMSEWVMSAFLRLVTNRKIFKTPTPLVEALPFIDTIRESDNCIIVVPGTRHWEIFAGLCRVIDAKGNDIPDAYLAALAIESDCRWVTLDRGFARFLGLNWQLLEGPT
jgi:uncharacterized protein